MSLHKIIVASRSSKLAIRQSEIAIQHLKKIFPENFIFEIKTFITTGDKKLDIGLSDIGGKYLFTKEIEEALLSGEAHIAVHSMKDVEAEFDERLTFASLLRRDDPRDALISPSKNNIESLRSNSVIGTSSSRREIFASIIRPDFEFKLIRGNIETRIRKVNEESYDATFLAMAGLNRLGINNDCIIPLSTNIFIPAIAQGVIGLQVKKDFKFIDLVRNTSDPNTEITTICERELMKSLEADCKTPIAGYATIEGSSLFFNAMYKKKDKFVKILGERGYISDPKSLAYHVCEKIRSKIN